MRQVGVYKVCANRYVIGEDAKEAKLSFLENQEPMTDEESLTAVEVITGEMFTKAVEFVKRLYTVPGMTCEQAVILLTLFFDVSPVTLTQEEIEEVYGWCERLSEYTDEEE